MTEYEKRMNAAMEKFKSCAYSTYDEFGTIRCALDCYPVIDCQHCTSHKQKEKEGSK